MKFLKIGLCLWQLPQILLGVFFSKAIWRNKLDKTITTKDIKYLHGLEKLTAKKIHVVKADYLKGIASFSLGYCVILKLSSLHNLKTIKHECIGHSKQSIRYGWFYLPTVGLVSIARNIISRYFAIDYYGGWPEKQADKLAGVIR